MWKCSCSASFETEVKLEEHLGEYQRREQWLQSEAENCRRHRNQGQGQDGVNSDHVDDSEKYENDPKCGPLVRKQAPYSCPSPDCPRSTPLTTWKSLRRHYEQHVSCAEVCVGCFKVFRATSSLVRHLHEPCVKSLPEMKQTYMQDVVLQLREKCQYDLRSAFEMVEVDVTTKKRRRTHSTAESNIPRLYALDPPIRGLDPVQTIIDDQLQHSHQRDSIQCPDINKIRPPNACLQPSQSELGSAQDPAFIGTFPATGPGYFNDASDQRPDIEYQDNFDAPLLHIMNSVPLKPPSLVGVDVNIQTDFNAGPLQTMHVHPISSTWTAEARLSSQENFNTSPINTQPLQNMHTSPLRSTWMAAREAQAEKVNMDGSSRGTG